MRNRVKSTCLTVRLNVVKELKSKLSEREFQQLITRSLKKLARTQCVFWHLKSLNACPRVT